MNLLSEDLLGMIAMFVNDTLTFSLISKSHLHVCKRFVCKVCQVITSPKKRICHRCGLVKERGDVRLRRSIKIFGNVSHKFVHKLLFVDPKNIDESQDPFIKNIRRVNMIIRDKKIKNQIF